MTVATLTSSVDTFIRIAKVEQHWHDTAPLTVLKYMGEERQEVRQMNLIIDRPTEISMEAWKRAIPALGDHVEVEMSTDDPSLPARVMIDGHWCVVSTVQHLI